MKRIYLVSAAVTLFGAIWVSVPAAAQADCEVGPTGPDSQNICESAEDYQCSIQNENLVIINNTTKQEAYSGKASSINNGSGGSASSGSVTNNTGTTFTVSISNGGGSENEPATCVVSAVAPAPAPENPETPKTPEPGRGETGAPVTPSRTVTPQALPVTSGNQTGLVLIFAGSASLVALAAVLYRRLHL